MRVMLKVNIPVEQGNKAILDGSLPKAVMGFVEKMKPEACYFGPDKGMRTGIFFFDLSDPSDMPSITESFFMHLNAAVEMTPVMNLEDMKAGVEKARKALQKKGARGMGERK
jgi:hypothetical protein